METAFEMEAAAFQCWGCADFSVLRLIFAAAGSDFELCRMACWVFCGERTAKISAFFSKYITFAPDQREADVSKSILAALLCYSSGFISTWRGADMKRMVENPMRADDVELEAAINESKSEMPNPDTGYPTWIYTATNQELLTSAQKNMLNPNNPTFHAEFHAEYRRNHKLGNSTRKKKEAREKELDGGDGEKIKKKPNAWQKKKNKANGEQAVAAPVPGW